MATKYEVDDAKKAEKHDDEEDKDYKSGNNDAGYERDDAEKAEHEDDEEDADYGNYSSDDAQKEFEETMSALDNRYALRKDHENLKARMDALEKRLGAQSETPAKEARKSVSLDGTIKE